MQISMRTIAAAIVMLLCAITAHAGPVPAEASGGYLTGERACRIVWARAPESTTIMQLDCLRWSDGRSTRALFRIYTPGGQCPSEASAFDFEPMPASPKAIAMPGVWYMTESGWRPMAEKAGQEWFSIRSYTASGAGALSVVVGTDPSAVASGIGQAQTWPRVAPLASPAPYTCSPPTPQLRFRVFGR